MSLFDEPNHLNQVIETINEGQNYSDDEMKCFQHGLASPFMLKELIQEIALEEIKYRETNERYFSEFCKQHQLLGESND